MSRRVRQFGDCLIDALKPLQRKTVSTPPLSGTNTRFTCHPARLPSSAVRPFRNISHAWHVKVDGRWQYVQRMFGWQENWPSHGARSSPLSCPKAAVAPSTLTASSSCYAGGRKMGVGPFCAPVTTQIELLVDSYVATFLQRPPAMIVAEPIPTRRNKCVDEHFT